MSDPNHPRGPPQVHLVLYVAGMGPRSSAAIPAVQDLCERHLHGRYTLDVVDLEAIDWSHGDADGVLAAPTLVRRSPGPRRSVVGDLADAERVLTALDLARVPG